MKKTILNSAGKPVLLNAREKLICDSLQRQLVQNALGFDIDITTMTTVMKKVTEQKFFEVAPADYLPFRVGEGAWSDQLLTYRSFQLADDFESGILNTGGNNGRLASADAGVDSVPVKVINWAKAVGWNLMELQQASKAGNWDIVTAKEISRKTNWDLGIQKIAFLGSQADSSVQGLLNLSGVTNDTTTLPQSISSLSVTDLKAFCTAVLNSYRSNCNRTAWPTHFIIPESDYLGLAAPSSAQFPIQSVLEQLEKTFKTMTKNANFKILPLAYADSAYHTSVSALVGKNVYVLLNYDEKSLRMDLPVDYTNTLANSINNFSFENVGYGQFTGVVAYRPLEVLYFTYTA